MSREFAQRQESLYSFPYHYLVSICGDMRPSISRSLSWGFEYLTYMNVVRGELEAFVSEGSSLLDVGCGDGYLLNTLGASLQKHGVDLSARAIAFARAFSVDALFEVRDIQEIVTQYDVVTCIEVLEHVPDDALEHFVCNMIRLVKDGGYLIVSVPTTVVDLNPKHYRHYDEALLSVHLETHHQLKVLKERRVYRVSTLLKVANRLLHNGFWTINFAPLLKVFWQWHLRSNIDASEKDGAHLIRVYQKG